MLIPSGRILTAQPCEKPFAEGAEKQFYPSNSEKELYCIAKPGCERALKKEVQRCKDISKKLSLINEELHLYLKMDEAPSEQQVRGKYTLIVDKASGDLEKTIEQAGTNWDKDRAIKAMKQIIAGMKNLHDVGFIHGDFKLDNILVFSKGEGIEPIYKITDFGKSLEVTRNQIGLYRGNSIFASPEAEQKWESSAKGEVFSVALGCIQLLGTSLRQEGKPSDLQGIKKLLHEDPSIRRSIKGQNRIKKLWKRIKLFTLYFFCVRLLGRPDSRAENISKKIHEYVDNMEGFSEQLKSLLKRMTQARPEDRPSMDEVYKEFEKLELLKEPSQSILNH